MRYFLCLFLLIPTGCTRPQPAPKTFQTIAPRKISAAGLHNVYQVSDHLYSGSSPEGDEGFASLRQLGIKTIISVDGAKPDLARAKKFDMRYGHVPIGYDGVPEDKGKQLAKAVRDLPGPVYIHCHHGKHRGPAATAVVLRSLDGACSAEQAAAWLKQAGTDPRYTGLLAAPSKTRLLTEAELADVSAEVPEVAGVSSLAEQMVLIDERWDHIKQIRAAGWKAPSNHPDLVPAQEALMLAEAYRMAVGDPKAKTRDELHAWMAEAEAEANELSASLRKGDSTAAEKAYKAGAATCNRCHAKYRDKPRAEE